MIRPAVHILFPFAHLWFPGTSLYKGQCISLFVGMEARASSCGVYKFYSLADLASFPYLFFHSSCDYNSSSSTKKDEICGRQWSLSQSQIFLLPRSHSHLKWERDHLVPHYACSVQRVRAIDSSFLHSPAAPSASHVRQNLYPTARGECPNASSRIRVQSWNCSLTGVVVASLCSLILCHNNNILWLPFKSQYFPTLPTSQYMRYRS